MSYRRSKYIFAKKKPLRKRIATTISDFLPEKKVKSNYSFDMDSVTVAPAADFYMESTTGTSLRSGYAESYPDYAKVDYFDNDDLFNEKNHSTSLNPHSVDAEFENIDYSDYVVENVIVANRRASSKTSIFSRIINGITFGIGSMIETTAGAFSMISRKTAVYMSGGLIGVAVLALVALLIVNSNSFGVSVTQSSVGQTLTDENATVQVEEQKGEPSEEDKET